jgi:hypothetical protein
MLVMEFSENIVDRFLTYQVPYSSVCLQIWREKNKTEVWLPFCFVFVVVASRSFLLGCISDFIVCWIHRSSSVQLLQTEEIRNFMSSATNNNTFINHNSFFITSKSCLLLSLWFVVSFKE